MEHLRSELCQIQAARGVLTVKQARITSRHDPAQLLSVDDQVPGGGGG